VRTRSSANPGGIGHEWVKQRFLVEGPSRGRIFVPSKLEDNPHLDKEEYDASLRELDAVTYAQLRWGDWAVRPPGAFFKRGWFQVDQAFPSGIEYIRMWDFAATKNQSSAYTAGALLGLHRGELYIADMRHIRGHPGEVEQLVKQTAQLDGPGVPVWIEQEPGSGGINTIFNYQHTVLVGYAVHAYHPHHDKLTRAAPLAALAQRSGVHILARPFAGPLIDEFDAFPDGFRDQVDTCSAGLLTLAQRPTYRIRTL
jgi:predicted phage terminase large subunit-like protein